MRRSSRLLYRNGHSGSGRAQCPRRSRRPGGYGARQRHPVHSAAAPGQLVPRRARLRPHADLGVVMDRAGAAVSLLGVFLMRRAILLAGVAALMCAASLAHATESMLPTGFLGDWCVTKSDERNTPPPW